MARAFGMSDPALRRLRTFGLAAAIEPGRTDRIEGSKLPAAEIDQLLVKAAIRADPLPNSISYLSYKYWMF
jgi:hypothetical protein